MAKRRPFWRDFVTKASLAAAIRAIVDSANWEEQFESSLLSDLVAERHWYCGPHMLRPEHFIKHRSNGYGPYDLLGWFGPVIGYHAFTWIKCISPKTFDTITRRALRTAISGQLATYKAKHLTCEKCGSAPAAEVDHVLPEFDSMYRDSVAGLSDVGRGAILKMQDWDDPGEFLLPGDHPVLKRFLSLHETAQLQAVCRPCHLLNAKERKVKR